MAKEYIPREAAIKARNQSCKRNCAECDFAVDGDSWCEGEVFVVDLLRIPAADVVEVRHGRWEWDRRIESYRCSSCQQHNADRTAFCPNCGAKMDGGQEPPKEEA